MRKSSRGGGGCGHGGGSTLPGAPVRKRRRLARQGTRPSASNLSTTRPLGAEPRRRTRGIATCGASVSARPEGGGSTRVRRPTTPPRGTMVGAPRRETLRVTTGPLAPSLVDQVVNHVIVVGRVTCRRARPSGDYGLRVTDPCNYSAVITVTRPSGSTTRASRRREQRRRHLVAFFFSPTKVTDQHATHNSSRVRPHR